MVALSVGHVEGG